MGRHHTGFLVLLLFVAVWQTQAKHLISDGKVPHAEGHFSMNDLSMQAGQTLLDLSASLDLGTISAAPVPIYRFDLRQDYVAYWEITTDSGEVIVISNGPETGDSKFVFQGHVPSRTQLVDDAAKAMNSSCSRYIMMSLAAHVACTNSEGYLIAYEPLGQDKDDVSEQTVTWQDQAAKTASEWLDQVVVKEAELSHLQNSRQEVEGERNETINDGQEKKEKPAVLHEYEVVPGDSVTIALGDPVKLRYVEIVAIGPGDDEDALQSSLCTLLQICDKMTRSLVSQAAIGTDWSTGLTTLHLEVAENARDLVSSPDLTFLVLIHVQEDDVAVRRYSIDLDLQRHKRRTERQSWSGWSSSFIPCSSQFPNYGQHSYSHEGRRCAVGCGPVAWAMVFGYMDRASHYTNCKTGGEALFRCTGGTSGSNACVAPSTTTSDIRAYTEELNSVMRTWCMFGQGATLPGRMDAVAAFYRLRQSNGRLVEKKTFRSTLGINQDDIASWTRQKISQGWPVIVGYKISAFSWHYPVAVGYRQRSRRYRSCYWGSCGSWDTEHQYQMYLNMGWEGSRNGYYNMQVFYGIAAVY